MDEKRAVVRADDELAEEYAARRSPDPGAPDLLARLLAAVDPGERVLDAGCGQGTPVLAALTGTARAVGLDVSREQLGLAADAVPGAALVRGDLTRLPFRAGSFDAATAYHSLIHVPLADHGTVLSEFARVLRSGALLLVTGGRRALGGGEP
jgi:ubiquinone/menaquinone biosynthesis C-methylase UbiE